MKNYTMRAAYAARTVKRVFAGLLCLLLFLTWFDGAVFAADSILINDKPLTSITGSSFGDTPVYFAQLEEGTTSFAFNTPDGWYVRCADSDGYVYNTFATEDTIAGASWFNSPSAAIRFMNGDEASDEELSDAEIKEYLTNNWIELTDPDDPKASFNAWIESEYNGYLGFWGPDGYGAFTPVEENNLEVDYLSELLFWTDFNNSSISKDQTAKYYLLYFFSDLNEVLNPEVMAEKAVALVLVQIGGTGTSSGVDTTDLEAEIAKVTGENASHYYGSDGEANDRYNGKSGEDGYSLTGFWADMQPKLTSAQNIVAEGNATQDEVDAATASLSAAIEKLISKDNLNTTELYETLRRMDNNFTDNNLQNYTAASVAEFKTARATEWDYLHSLFDANGVPTGENKNNEEKRAIYEEHLSAATNLYQILVDPASITRSQAMINGLPALVSAFSADGVRDASATEAYSVAQALVTVAGTTLPNAEEMSGIDIKKWTDAYTDLQKAAWGIAPTGSVTVTLRVADN